MGGTLSGGGAPPGYVDPPAGMTLAEMMQGPSPYSPAELDALAGSGLYPDLAAEMAANGQAAAFAAGLPVPACVQVGGAWQVGSLAPDGVTFACQFTATMGWQARRLAYGWNSPANGLATIRQALGITLGAAAPQPIG